MAREAGKQRCVRPQDIFFTTDAIRARFQKPHDQLRIDDVVNLIIEGDLSPQAFPPISVVEHRQRLWALDNRRLWVFRKAEVNFITVNIVDGSPKLSLILDTPGLNTTFSDPNFFPRVRENLTEHLLSTPDKHERAAAPPASVLEKRKHSRPEKRKRDSTLPSYRSGYCPEKPSRASRLDNDLFECRSPSTDLKEKFAEGKVKDKCPDMTSMEAGQGNGRSRSKAESSYTAKGIGPKGMTLSDSSCGPNRAGADVEVCWNATKVVRAKSLTPASDEEQLYENDAIATNYLSDTSEDLLVSSTRQRRNQRTTSPRRSPRGLERGKDYGARASLSFHSVGKDSESSARKGIADCTTAIAQEREPYEIPGDAAATRDAGRSIMDISSEEEMTPPPQKKLPNKSISKHATPEKCDVDIHSQLQTPVHALACGPETPSRCIRGLTTPPEERKAEKSHEIKKTSQEAPLTPSLQAGDKRLLSGSPEYGKNEKNFSKSSAESDTLEASQVSKAGHRVWCSIACQTDSTLLEEPDHLVLNSVKNGEALKSEGTVQGLEKNVDVSHPESMQKVSQNSGQQGESNLARKLISKNQFLVDCPIKIVTRTDEIDRVFCQGKLGSPRLGPIQRRPQCAAGQLDSKTPNFGFHDLDKGGRTESAEFDEITRNALDYVRTVASSKPDATDIGFESKGMTSNIHKPITRSRSEPKQAAALQSQEERAKKLRSNSNAPEERVTRNLRSKSNPPMETITRTRSGRVSGFQPVYPDKRSVRRLVKRSQTGAINSKRAELQAGDMVYMFVNAFHSKSRKLLPNLRKIGPFQILRKINGHSAKLHIPEDYHYVRDTVNLTALTQEACALASGSCTTIPIVTAPEEILFRRYTRPYRKRHRSTQVLEYLVKWVSLSRFEATWETAAIFEDNPGLLEGPDAEFYPGNPFLLRSLKC